MTWRPGHTALFTQTVLCATAVLLCLLLVVRLMWALPVLSAAIFVTALVATLFLLLWQRSVLLICLLPREATTVKVGASLNLMALPIHRLGAGFVLDKSRIEIRVISLMIFSGIVIKGGKSTARQYIAEVLGKFINYRKHGMEARNA